MSLTIVRVLEIDAGHRLQNHESKCRHAHGHRYRFHVTASAESLDQVGRVIDFGALKRVLGGWLDEHWDHAFLFEAGDPIGDWLSTNDQRRYALASPPTAENIAKLFLGVARELMRPHGISIDQVTVWETPNCSATAT